MSDYISTESYALTPAEASAAIRARRAEPDCQVQIRAIAMSKALNEFIKNEAAKYPGQLISMVLGPGGGEQGADVEAKAASIVLEAWGAKGWHIADLRVDELSALEAPGIAAASGTLDTQFYVRLEELE